MLAKDPSARFNIQKVRKMLVQSPSWERVPPCLFNPIYQFLLSNYLTSMFYSSYSFVLLLLSLFLPDLFDLFDKVLEHPWTKGQHADIPRDDAILKRLERYGQLEMVKKGLLKVSILLFFFSACRYLVLSYHHLL